MVIKKIVRVLGILLITLAMLNCGKPPDQKAYEEVISTMSLNKAKEFLSKYPQSKYSDKLVNDIIRWCDHDSTKECYEMVFEIIPKNHSKYSELADSYKKSISRRATNKHQNDRKDSR